MSHCCCHASNQDQSPKYFKQAKINAIFSVVFLFINIFQISYGIWFGLGLALMSVIMMYYSGKEFYQSAFEALKNKKTNMNSLVALSTIIALVYSVLLCLFPSFFQVVTPHYYFCEMAMILGIVNLGRGLRFQAEYKIKQRTQNHAALFKKYQPLWAVRVNKINHKKKRRIKASNIKIGDIIQIKPNKRFPVEGDIVAIFNRSRNSWIDEKNITGESTVVKKSIGDSVLSGTRNTKDTIWIRSTVKGNESNLSKLLKSFELAPQSKIEDSPLINTVSYYFVPSIITIAFITGGVGLYLAPVAMTALPSVMSSVMSVLLCACPCALGLATPLSSTITSELLLEKGILVKNANSFEKAAFIDTIFFDKTGTLTQPIIHTLALESIKDNHWLEYVASLEKHHKQSHPIASAIIQKAAENNYQDYPVLGAITDAQGMRGRVNNHNMMIGSLEYCQHHGASISSYYLKRAKQLELRGQTTVLVVANLQCVGIIGLKHKLKPGTKKHINALKARGIQVGLLTGDKKGPARTLAKALGIDSQWVYHGYSADKKLKKIKSLQKQGKVVAMVGDGMNDMAACRAADLGLAIHAWTNAAVECDVALQGSVKDIIHFFKVSELVNNNIKQNIAWTFVYNSIALMGATGLLYPIGCCALNPIVASGLMALSSIIVIANAQRLPGLMDGVLEEEQTHIASEQKQPIMPYVFSPIYNEGGEILSSKLKTAVSEQSEPISPSIAACCLSNTAPAGEGPDEVATQRKRRGRAITP